MNIFLILVNQILLFAIYIGVGIALVRTRVFHQESLEILARFVIKVALPVLIFINTLNGVKKNVLLGSIPVLGVVALMYLLLFGLNYAMSHMFRLKGNRFQLYVALGMFGNAGFMGIPIITSILGDKGMLYISLLTIIDQLVLWTLGVRLTTPCEEEESKTRKFNLKKMLNPATIAITSAIVLICCNASVPAVVNTAMVKIGGTATPLAMIYLGGLFACTNIRQYIAKIELYGIVLVKMIAFPVAFYLFLGLINVSHDLRITMTLLSALPSMTSVAMMANASGSEGDYAISTVFVTTVCSMVTLPVVYLLSSFIA